MTGNTPASPTHSRWPHAGYLAGLGVLVAVVLAAFWMVSDSGRVKGLVEQAVTALSDRRFVIAGEFELSLGRTAVIKAERVRWSNATWAAEPYMLEVSEFTATVDLLSVIRPPVTVIDIAARDARVRIETSPDGLSNWSLGDVDAVDDATDPPSPLPLHLVAATLKNVLLTISNPGLQQPIDIRLVDIKHLEDAAHRLVLAGSIVVAGREQQLAGRIGPLPELAVAGAVDFDFSLTGPLAALSTQGSFSELATLRDPNLRLQVAATDAAAVLQALQLPPAAAGSVQLDADIATAAGGIAATANGHIGDFIVNGSLAARNLQTYDEFKLDLVLSGGSLRRAGTLAGYGGLPDAAYSFDVHAARTEQGLEVRQFSLATTGLNIDGSGIARALPELRDFDLQFSASGDDFSTVAELLGYPVDYTEAFAVNAAVTGNGAGSSDDLRLELELGPASGTVTGSITEDAEFAGSQFSIAMVAPNVQPFARAVGLEWRAPAAVALRTRMAVDSGDVRLSDIDVELGANRLTGNATLRGSDSAIDFSGVLKGPNMSALVGSLVSAAEVETVPPLPYTATANITYVDGSLRLATEELTLGASRFTVNGTVMTNQARPAIDLQVTAEGASLADLVAHLQIADVPDGPFSARTRLVVADDTVSFNDLQFTAAGAELSGRLKVGGGAAATVDFDLSAEGQNLNSLVPDTDAYQPADVPFKVTAAGVFASNAVALKALDAKVGKARFTVAGNVTAGSELAVRALKVEGSGPRLSDLGKVASWRLSDVPFGLSATLGGTPRQLEVNDLQLSLGQNEIAGQLTYRADQRPYLSAALTSRRLNLNELREIEPRDKPQTSPKAPAQALLSDEPLPFEMLTELDADVTLRFADVTWDMSTITDLDVAIALRDGVLDARRINLAARGGRLEASGSVTPGPDGHTVALAAKADHLQLAFTAATAAQKSALPRYALDLQLVATGNSARQLAGSANGYAWAIAGSGEMRRLMLGPLVGDFATELVSAINPFVKKKKTVAVDCEGYYLELKAGAVETAPALVFQTAEVTIVASGSVDLKTERIDFTFQTTPRKGIGVSLSDLTSPFTKVTGTLAAPKISLDAKNAAIEGGAAVATAGLSILAKSLFNRWIGTREVCAKMADKAATIRADRDPANVPDLEQFAAGVE